MCQVGPQKPAPVVFQVKIAYINFLNHCYVDTEVEMKEIYTSNHMWKLFENFLVDICRVRLSGAAGRSACVCACVERVCARAQASLCRREENSPVVSPRSPVPQEADVALTPSPVA